MTTKANKINFIKIYFILLFLIGCDSDHDYERKNENTTAVEEGLCRHLDIQFGNVMETFSECAGYDIDVGFEFYNSKCRYVISKDGSTYISGTTNSYHFYSINHNAYEGDNPAMQKVK